jgi:hypothetical protein
MIRAAIRNQQQRAGKADLLPEEVKPRDAEGEDEAEAFQSRA